MKNAASKWKPKEIADLAFGFSFACFGLSAFLLAVDAFSSFMTGNLLLKRFAVDISFAGWGLLSKYIGNKYLKKDQMQ